MIAANIQAASRRRDAKTSAVAWLCRTMLAAAALSTLLDWRTALGPSRIETPAAPTAVAAPAVGPRLPIHEAAESGDVATLAALLATSRKDVDAPDPSGKTPFRLAAEHGDLAALIRLWHAGADIGVPASDGLAAIHAAAANSRTAMFWAHLMSAPGPRVLPADLASPGLPGSGRFGWTPLHWAASAGNDPAILALLKAGANPNARDSFGWTPLHVGASSSAGGAGLFRSAGADVGARDIHGETPLHVAARTGNDAAALELIAAGADQRALNSAGRTPSDVARTSGFQPLADAIDGAAPAVAPKNDPAPSASAAAQAGAADHRQKAARRPPHDLLRRP